MLEAEHGHAEWQPTKLDEAREFTQQLHVAPLSWDDLVLSECTHSLAPLTQPIWLERVS